MLILPPKDLSIDLVKDFSETTRNYKFLSTSNTHTIAEPNYELGADICSFSQSQM